MCSSGCVATDSYNGWSPKSQVMLSSAFSWIGDCFVFLALIVLRYGHFVEYVTKPCDGQCNVTIISLSPRGSRSKAVANYYRHEYHHKCRLWTLVLTIMHWHVHHSCGSFEKIESPINNTSAGRPYFSHTKCSILSIIYNHLIFGEIVSEIKSTICNLSNILYVTKLLCATVIKRHVLIPSVCT